MSENTPKEIKRYNSNIKMSKNNSKNKILNYNLQNCEIKYWVFEDTCFKN